MDYIANTLGVKIATEPWGGSVGLPFHLTDAYAFQTVTLDGAKYLFVKPTGELASLPVLRKHLGKIAERATGPSGLSRQRREKARRARRRRAGGAGGNLERRPIRCVENLRPQRETARSLSGLRASSFAPKRKPQNQKQLNTVAVGDTIGTSTLAKKC
uniref:Uncharacterized protein n=1 Tax=uncultured bacterium contig00005 TaxID=1181497 RepID=A0A806KD62_9BACT|nr:hypothetical protein [uncultured bacterium contig00005]